MNPIVSVCIPAYEQPLLLSRALESVFSQKCEGFEVIVTDDSKSGDVEAVVSRWAKDIRLRYFRNPVRLGSPANWNHAMSLARGRYIKFLHHDDWFAHSAVLQTFVDVMLSQPDTHFAFSACRNVYPAGAISEHILSAEQVAILQASPLELHYGNLIGDPSTTIFRNEGGFVFDEQLKWVVDVEAYLRLMQKTMVIYLVEPLVNVTAGGEHQITREFERDQVARVEEHLYIYQRHPFSIWADRIRFSMWIRRCLVSGLSRREWSLLKQRRRAKNQSYEERLAFLANDCLLFLRSALRRA